MERLAVLLLIIRDSQGGSEFSHLKKLIKQLTSKVDKYVATRITCQFCLNYFKQEIEKVSEYIGNIFKKLQNGSLLTIASYQGKNGWVNFLFCET